MSFPPREPYLMFSVLVFLLIEVGLACSFKGLYPSTRIRVKTSTNKVPTTAKTETTTPAANLFHLTRMPAESVPPESPEREVSINLPDKINEYKEEPRYEIDFFFPFLSGDQPVAKLFNQAVNQVITPEFEAI